MTLVCTIHFLYVYISSIVTTNFQFLDNKLHIIFIFILTTKKPRQTNISYIIHLFGLSTVGDSGVDHTYSLHLPGQWWHAGQVWTTADWSNSLTTSPVAMVTCDVPLPVVYANIHSITIKGVRRYQNSLTGKYIFILLS